MAEAAVDLVVSFTALNCGSCGAAFALPADELRRLRASGDFFWCPRGCHIKYSESTVAKLERQLAQAGERIERERRETERWRENYKHSERSAIATRGHLTRVKKRIAAGVCPCCQRTFENLARHMKGQHPDYCGK